MKKDRSTSVLLSSDPLYQINVEVSVNGQRVGGAASWSWQCDWCRCRWKFGASIEEECVVEDTIQTSCGFRSLVSVLTRSSVASDSPHVTNSLTVWTARWQSRSLAWYKNWIWTFDFVDDPNNVWNARIKCRSSRRSKCTLSRHMSLSRLLATAWGLDDFAIQSTSFFVRTTGTCTMTSWSGLWSGLSLCQWFLDRQSYQRNLQREVSSSLWENGTSMMIRDASVLVRIDEVWIVVDRVMEYVFDDWKNEERHGSARDPKILSRYSGWTRGSLRDVMTEMSCSRTIDFDFPFDIPAVHRLAGGRCATETKRSQGYHDTWDRSSDARNRRQYSA